MGLYGFSTSKAKPISLAAAMTPNSAASSALPMPQGAFAGTVPNLNLNGDPITSLQNYQNQANAANNDRYNQGLSILGDAEGLADKLGATGQQRINQNYTQAVGHTAQSAVSRGLGNTTIVDSLQRGNSRDKELAQQSLDESVAGQKIAAKNREADFIASRNDQAPDIGLYASLLERARASQQSSQPQTITTIGASAKGLMGGGPLTQADIFGGSTGGSAGGFVNPAQTAAVNQLQAAEARNRALLGGDGTSGGSGMGYYFNGTTGEAQSNVAGYTPQTAYVLPGGTVTNGIAPNQQGSITIKRSLGTAFGR